MTGLQLKIMSKAFRIRMGNGEVLEAIIASYPALNENDIAFIREELNDEN